MPASHRKMRRAADIHRLSTRTYNLRCPQGLGYDPGLGRSGDGMNELTKFDGGSADAQTAEALPHSARFSDFAALPDLIATLPQRKSA